MLIPVGARDDYAMIVPVGALSVIDWIIDGFADRFGLHQGGNCKKTPVLAMGKAVLPF